MSSLDDGPQESFDKVKVTEAAAWPVALASCAVTKMSDADGNGDDNGDDNDNGDFLRACVVQGGRDDESRDGACDDDGRDGGCDNNSDEGNDWSG